MKTLTSCLFSVAFALASSTALAADHAPSKDGMHNSDMMDMHHGDMKGMGEPKMMGEHFMKADTDKDGTLSKSEWQARGDAMFKEIDTDGDGKISRDEMRAHHEAMRAKWQERREEMKGKIEEMKQKKAAAPSDKH